MVKCQIVLWIFVAALIGLVGCGKSGKSKIKPIPTAPSPERIVIQPKPNVTAPTIATEKLLQKRPPLRVPAPDQLPQLITNNPKGLPNLRMIKVQRGETPGLIAAFANVKLGQLLKWNKLTLKSKIRIGQELTLVLDDEQMSIFTQRRRGHHQGRQDRFFAQFKVDTLNVYVVRKGDSASKIAHKFDKVPLWILKKFNKNKDLKRLVVGQTLFIPHLMPTGRARIMAKRRSQLPVDANYTGLIIRVKPRENLAMYAKWAGLNGRVLLRVNRLQPGYPVTIGQRFMLPLNDRAVNRFLARRIAYHGLRQRQLGPKRSIKIAQRYQRTVKFYQDQERLQKRLVQREKRDRIKKRKRELERPRRRVRSRFRQEPLQPPVSVSVRFPKSRLHRIVEGERKIKRLRQLSRSDSKRVRRVVKVRLAKGDTVWLLATKKYHSSLELVRKYNQGKNLDRLQIGETINIPILAKSKRR